jgi:hypothetical protein
MNIGRVDLIGYAIGLLSVLISIILYKRSQRKHKERLTRLLDPYVIHQDLLKCRERIRRGAPPKILQLLRRSDPSLYGLHDLRILQRTIRNVQKYILVVRSENYTEYERLLAEAMDFLTNGEPAQGIKVLDEAIALLAAEAKVLSE